MATPLFDDRMRRRQKARNILQGLLLFAAMVAAFALLVWLIFGLVGLLMVGVMAATVLLLRPRVPTRWMLAMYSAQPLPERAAPQLHRYVRELTRRAGISRPPRLYYVASPIMNAFAVGRGNDAALAVTDGLLRGLTAREVVGVLAHEISHIRAGDTTIMSLSDAIGRLVQGLSYVGIFVVVATLPLIVAGDLRPLLVAAVLIVLPTVVTLLQFALSRSREYDADLEGASLTGDPEGLAGALEALQYGDGRIWERILVPHGRVPDPLLLRTHPPTDERTRRLRALTPRRHRPLPTSGVRTAPAGYSRVVASPRLRPPGIRW